MANYNLPKFLIVGTAKAGTTSIYHYLKRHPQLFLPVKETFFFNHSTFGNKQLPYPQQRNNNDVVKNENTYKKCFEGGEGKIAGEIGTGYLYNHKEAIPLIKKVLGSEVKIAIVLRDPVERAYSSYLHFVKDMHEKASFAEAMKLEAARKEEGWDFMWQHRELGAYARQVSAYIQAFPNVRVFYFEDLKKDESAFMKSFCDFIGVESLEEDQTKKKYNTSGTARIKWLQQFITGEGPVKKFFRPLFRLLFNAKLREKIRKYVKNKNMKGRDQMSKEDREHLLEYYSEDLKELKQILNQKIPFKSAEFLMK